MEKHPESLSVGELEEFQGRLWEGYRKSQREGNRCRDEWRVALAAVGNLVDALSLEGGVGGVEGGGGDEVVEEGREVE